MIQLVNCLLLPIAFSASVDFNPHTKTEIPGVEKIRMCIKVTAMLCFLPFVHLPRLEVLTYFSSKLVQ